MLGVAATSGPMLLVGLGVFGYCVRCKLHYGLVFTTLIFFFFLSFLFPLSFPIEHGCCAAVASEQSPQSPGRGGQSAARPCCSTLPREPPGRGSSSSAPATSRWESRGRSSAVGSRTSPGGRREPASAGPAPPRLSARPGGPVPVPGPVTQPPAGPGGASP